MITREDITAAEWSLTSGADFKECYRRMHLISQHLLLERDKEQALRERYEAALKEVSTYPDACWPTCGCFTEAREIAAEALTSVSEANRDICRHGISEIGHCPSEAAQAEEKG